jgi:hypothetical protein
MGARKHEVELGDLTWLLYSEPSDENLARAEKLRTILGNQVAVVDGILLDWRKRLGVSTAQSAPDARPQKIGHTVRTLITHYLSDPSSPYRSKQHASRQQTDSLCRIILDDMGDKKLSDITADYMHDIHAKWIARAATRGRGDGKAMGHALITQLRTTVNYGAKDLQDSDCLRLSFTLRNLRIKMVKHRKSEPLNKDQVRLIMRTAREMGYPSIALAQALQFECNMRQRDVIGEWIPIGDKGAPSEYIHEGQKWVRGIRWNEINEDWILCRAATAGQKPIRIDLKSKELVMSELKRFARHSNQPIILEDQAGEPWPGWKFRSAWRQIARKAGIPDDVLNMNSRAKGAPRDNEDDSAAQAAV